MLSKKEQELIDALEPRAVQENVEIVTIEVVGAKKSPTIRIYIDTPNGVSFDELASAQSWIDEIIERIDPFPGAYTLEVSSPGIDRPLRTPEHFARFVGEKACVKTSEQIEGRATFNGTIEAADAETVTIACEDKSYIVPFAVVKRANLKGTYEFTS